MQEYISERHEYDMNTHAARCRFGATINDIDSKCDLLSRQMQCFWSPNMPHYPGTDVMQYVTGTTLMLCELRVTDHCNLMIEIVVGRVHNGRYLLASWSACS